MAGRWFAGRGMVHYNGYTFPPAVSCKVFSEPQYDSTGRTIKWVEYTLTVETVVVSGDAPGYKFHDGSPATGVKPIVVGAGGEIDNHLDSIRSLLQRPGGTLYFTHQGFGDDFVINANTGETQYDVAYGPKPELLVWEPIASGIAARIIWTCEVHIPECHVPSFHGKLMEYSYSAEWSINDEGMTTRTISGRIEIPANRKPRGTPARPADMSAGSAHRAITDCADNYRHLVKIPPMGGFLRTQDYRLAADKRGLEFRIVDTEVPSESAFEPGCVKMEASHRMQSGFKGKPNVFGGFGFVQWRNSLNARIILAPTTPRSAAWGGFLMIFKDRVKNITSASAGEVKDHLNAPRKIFDRYWVWDLEIDESIYSREFRFRVQWTSWFNLKHIWKNSRIFVPVNNNDWTIWTTTMAPVFDQRGYAQLKTTESNDTIVDLCGGTAPVMNSSYNKDVGEADEEQTDEQDRQDFWRSWGEFENDFYIEFQTNAAEYGKVQNRSPQELVDNIQSTGGQTPNVRGQDGFRVGDEWNRRQANYLQMRGESMYRVRMVGHAVRFGRTIPCPKLSKFGGAIAYARGGRFMHKMLVKSSQNPLYVAAWDRVYYLADIPATARDLMDYTDTLTTSGLPEDYA